MLMVTQVVEKSELPADIQELCEQYNADFIRKAFIQVKEPELKEGERAEITYVSTVDQDRDDEVLLPSGCDLREFKKAPQVLWGHDYKQPPIGSDEWIRTDSRGILAKTIYAETPRGEEVWQLVRARHLRTSSVGFIPIKWMNKNDEGWEKFIDKLAKQGITINRESCKRIYTKWLLLEHSKVSVPANINALTVDVAKGLFRLSEEMTKDLGLDFYTTKGVIPFRDYGKEPESAAWDAAAQVREADAETLRKICTWFDSANPELKTSYKLPHHKAATLKANWRGVAAAMAALLGARGGVDIPGNDKKGCHQHLSSHYRQFDKEPPELRDYSELELKGLFADEWHWLAEELEWSETCAKEGWEDLGASLKPYPNEHACRLEDPNKYSRFARQNDRFGAGIHAIFGRRKTDGKSELQAIRFDKTKFTVAQAKKWCADHNHTCRPFEPATQNSRELHFCSICDPAPASKFLQVTKTGEDALKEEATKAFNRALGKV